MSNIKEDDSILINRNQTDFKITTQDLKNYVDADDTYDDYLQGDDLLLINHDGIDYNVTLHDFKEYSSSLKPPEPEPTTPWVGHDGGIWHIQNLRGKDLEVNGGWAGSRDPVQVYAMDGTDLGMMQVIPQTLGEFMVLSNGNENCLFNGGYDQDKFQFDFGPLTDTSKVVNFIGLIGYNAVINPAGMENFDTSNVICMHGTFEYCTAFDRDISGWDTSSVIQDYYQPVGALGGSGMSRMFLEAHAFNKDLSGWCVTNLTSAPSGFADDTPAWTLPEPVWGTCPRGENMHWLGHPGGIWHIRNVTSKLTLKDTNTFTAWKTNGTELGKIGEVNPGEEVVFVTARNASELFAKQNADAEFEIGPLTDTSLVNNMKGLFRNNNKFKGVGVEYMDVSNVTTMESMFQNNKAFNGDVSGWDVSKLEIMSYMFVDTTVFNQDISGWNTSNVTRMIHTFNGTGAFNQDIGGWDTSKVGNMSSMFSKSVAFNQNISPWDVSNVTSMTTMFSQAKAFNQNLSQWCVIHIGSNPSIDAGASVWTLPKPVWGTCPRGENQNRQVVTYNYTVTVNNTGYGNKYYLNGDQQQTIDALVGDTIVFDQSDSSNTGHPLRIYTDSAKTNEVTTGVTIDGSTTTFVVSEEGTFYYQCEVHSGMGSSITINN